MLAVDAVGVGCRLWVLSAYPTPQFRMPSDSGDGSAAAAPAASTSQMKTSIRKRSAFDVLSARPPKLLKPFKSGRASTGISGSKGGRVYAWYYKHFEPVDKEK